MARKTLLECSFLIPVRRDRNLAGGGPHPNKAWKWLREALLDFGGGTRSLELYEGWYLDPDTGERVTDLSRKYTVALPRTELTQLRHLLGKACAIFSQKCIYLSVAGHVEFVEE